MELDIDLVAYMWTIGILIVLVAVAGFVVAGASIRERNRRRKERLTDARSRQPWDTERPGSFDHG